MKKIFLFRHAKTEQNSSTGKDYDRMLNLQGLCQAHWLAGYFYQNEIEFETIIASSAKRTTQTSSIIFGNCREKINFTKDLYNAPFQNYLDKLATLKNETTIAFVGHNPGISDLASYFLDDYYNFSTGQVLELQFDIDTWKAIGKETGIEIKTIRPLVSDLF